MSLPRPIKAVELSHGGRAHFSEGGVIHIQQGHPWGPMAVPGEAFLSVEDLRAIHRMFAEAYAEGWRPDPPGTIRPAAL